MCTILVKQLFLSINNGRRGKQQFPFRSYSSESGSGSGEPTLFTKIPSPRRAYTLASSGQTDRTKRLGHLALAPVQVGTGASCLLKVDRIRSSVSEMQSM